MANFLVSGLINIETTLEVDEFPVKYSTVEYPFFSIDASVSGVGYNISKAITRLGNRVTFLSILGQDLAVASIRADLQANFIDDQYVIEACAQTARSIIMNDQDGRHKIIVDLKDVQDQAYPYAKVEKVMPNAELAILCNINFSRPMLALAQKSGLPIATDVHALSNLDDDYNHDFMQAANILFMSHDLLPVDPQEFAVEVMAKYNPEILVIGLGKDGALLSVRQDETTQVYPVIETRPVVNTIGAGDALFSAFVHEYWRTKDPYTAIRKAILFASYKIGVRSASDGFMGSSRLNEMYREHYTPQANPA